MWIGADVGVALVWAVWVLAAIVFGFLKIGFLDLDVWSQCFRVGIWVFRLRSLGFGMLLYVCVFVEISALEPWLSGLWTWRVGFGI